MARRAKRVPHKKRPAKRVVHKKIIKPDKRRVGLQERVHISELAKKANARLASLEKAGVKDLSRAYRNVEGFAAKYDMDGINLFKVDKEKGTIRFRSDIARLQKENPDLLKQLETRLKYFLQAPTSTKREVKRRRDLIEKDAKKYLKDLEKNHPKEFEALKKSVETINEGRRDARIYRGMDIPDITMEEYVRMFYTDIWGLIEQHITPSKERVEVAHKVATGVWNKAIVREYLESLSPGEVKNAADVQAYIYGGKTPAAKRQYAKSDWHEKADKVGGFTWYTGKKLF